MSRIITQASILAMVSLSAGVTNATEMPEWNAPQYGYPRAYRVNEGKDFGKVLADSIDDLRVQGFTDFIIKGIPGSGTGGKISAAFDGRLHPIVRESLNRQYVPRRAAWKAARPEELVLYYNGRGLGSPTETGSADDAPSAIRLSTPEGRRLFKAAHSIVLDEQGLAFDGEIIDAASDPDRPDLQQDIVDLMYTGECLDALGITPPYWGMEAVRPDFIGAVPMIGRSKFFLEHPTGKAVFSSYQGAVPGRHPLLFLYQRYTSPKGPAFSTPNPANAVALKAWFTMLLNKGFVLVVTDDHAIAKAAHTEWLASHPQH